MANEENINNIDNNIENHIDNQENNELEENEEQNPEQIEQGEQNEENKENKEINQEQIEQGEQNEENEENSEESDENSEDDNNNGEIEQNEIIENNKNEIDLFLDDLCKWFIGRLNDIISDLINQNSNDLGKAIFNEQITVKNNRNVKTSLPNEQSLDQCILESEKNLKPLITNKVYFSGLKNFYEIILDNLVEVCDAVTNKMFKSIIPDLRNYISDDKLKKISDEILKSILKNQ